MTRVVQKMERCLIFTGPQKSGEDFPSKTAWNLMEEHPLNKCLVMNQIFSNMKWLEITISIWAIYNDLSRGHPKWWFSKGIHPKMALN